MTTDMDENGQPSAASVTRLTQNLSKVDELRQRLTHVLTHRSTHQAALDAPNQELFAKAAQSYMQEAMTNPEIGRAHV